MEIWLKTDEAQDAIVSLEMAVDELSRVTSNLHYWKWTIIGLHNALQGFMVLALRGTSNLNVLREKDAKKWLDAYEQREKTPTNLRLDNYLDLYKKIKSDRMMMYTSSVAFQPKGTQGRSIKKLNSLRNDFIHFVPKGWLLETSGFPQITKDCIDVIEFLAFECGNVVWHELSMEAKTRKLIAKAKNELQRVDTNLATNLA